MKKLLGMLGLCARAGKLVTGEEACERLIRSGQAKVAFIDEAASGNAKKAMTNACSTMGVTLIEIPRGEIGRVSGKPSRMASAISDESFSAGIINIYRILSGVH